MLAYGSDVMDRLRQSFVASQFNLPKLLVEIATIAAVHGVEPSGQPRKNHERNPSSPIHPAPRSLRGRAPVPRGTAEPRLARRGTAPPASHYHVQPEGAIPSAFWPDETGADFKLKEIVSPLDAYKDRTLILHGVCNKVRGDGDNHMRGMSCLLTGIELFPGNIQGGSDTPAGWASGISIDQEIKNFFQSREETRTRFGSLEFGVGVTDRPIRGRACLTPDRTSPWRRSRSLSDVSNVVRPAEGQGEPPEHPRRRARGFEESSAKLISPADRRLLAEHEALVRQMEKEINEASRQKLRVSPPTLEEGVADQNDNVPRLSRMQIDLLVNSFVNDMARVATLHTPIRSARPA